MDIQEWERLMGVDEDKKKGCRDCRDVGRDECPHHRDIEVVDGPRVPDWWKASSDPDIIEF